MLWAKIINVDIKICENNLFDPYLSFFLRVPLAFLVLKGPKEKRLARDPSYGYILLIISTFI